MSNAFDPWQDPDSEESKDFFEGINRTARNNQTMTEAGWGYLVEAVEAGNRNDAEKMANHIKTAMLWLRGFHVFPDGEGESLEVAKEGYTRVLDQLSWAIAMADMGDISSAKAQLAKSAKRLLHFGQGHGKTHLKPLEKALGFPLRQKNPERHNPINWSHLNWLKTSLVMVVSKQKETLSIEELEILRELLTTISQEFPEHRDIALAFAYRLPLGSGILWTPTVRHAVLEDQLRRVKQEEHQLWWDIYYFLNKFEEHPMGRLVPAPRLKVKNLDYLRDQVTGGNVLAIPDYVWEHIRLKNAPPDMHLPGISYWCSTHQKSLLPGGKIVGYGSGHRNQCPRTIYVSGKPWGREEPLDKPCRITPQPHQMVDWVSWAMEKNNLFAFKKTHCRQPMSFRNFMDAFYQIHQKDPAFILFDKELRHYFEHHLKAPSQIIAALNIPPDVPNWPIEVITWPELVKLTNLQTHLILGDPNAYVGKNSHIVRKIGILHENVWPLTILGFSHGYKNRYGTWEHGMPRQGITVHDERGNSGKPAVVECSTFG